MAASLQGAAGTGGSGSTTHTTSGTPFTTTSGGTALISFFYDSSAPTAVTDNKGNTYSLIATRSLGGMNCWWYASYNITGGAGHYATVTTSGNAWPSMHFAVFTGVQASPLDANVTSSDTGGQPWTASTGTLAQADEVVVSFVGFDGTGGNQTFTEGSGFTIASQKGDGNNYWPSAVGYKVVNSTTAVGASWTTDGPGAGSAQAPMMMVSLKASSGGGTSYSLAYDAASYAVTASAETLAATRALAVAATSYALTPAVESLSVGRRLSIDAASYALTASAETLTATRALSIAPASYSLTAADVDLVYGSTAKALDIEPASYALSLSDVGFGYSGGANQEVSYSTPTRKRKAKNYQYDYSSPKEPEVVAKPVKQTKAKKTIPADVAEMMQLLEASQSVTAGVLAEQAALRLADEQRIAQEDEMMAVIAMCL